MTGFLKIFATTAVVCWIGYVFSFGELPWSEQWLPKGIQKGELPAADDATRTEADLSDLHARLQNTNRRSAESNAAGQVSRYLSNRVAPSTQTTQNSNQRRKLPRLEVIVATWDAKSRALERALHDSDIGYVRRDVDSDPKARLEALSGRIPKLPLVTFNGRRFVPDSAEALVEEIRAERVKRSPNRF